MELKNFIKIEDGQLYLPISLDIEGVVHCKNTTLLSTSSFRHDTTELCFYPVRFFQFRTTSGKIIPLGDFSPTRAFHLFLSLDGINHFFPQNGNDEQLADREVCLIDYIERSVKDTGLRGSKQRDRWKEEQFRHYGIE